VSDAVEAEVRLYDRLFTEAHPEADGKDFLKNLNPNSLSVVTAYVEPSLAKVPAGQRFQFERHGYFVTDLLDHVSPLNGGEGKSVFNRVTGMKDSWGK
jgi:glutaminyl-tRNA synthetase